MQTTRRFGKSMFQRRVLILAACAVVVNLLLATQLFRLAVDQGEQHLQVAQSRLQVQTWLPTWRGSIFDRNGRVLAEDRPAYDVSLSYDAITGAWIDRKASRDARETAGSERWRAMGPGERDSLIQEHRAPHDEQIEEIWELLSRVSGRTRTDLEAARNQILQRVQHMAAVVWQRQRQQHESRFGIRGDAPEFRERPIAEQEAFHVILPNVDDAQAIRLQQLAAGHPDLVKVEYSRSRWRPESARRVNIEGSGLPRGLHSDETYPIKLNDVGIQIIGDVRRGIWEEDMQRRPFRDARTGAVDPGGYMIDDEIGSHGIELALEDDLRGTRGSINRRRDRSSETRVEPEPGSDVQLTIDIDLQARLEALLSGEFGLTTVQSWHGDSQLAPGTLLNAAAVVLEIESGEILAMASFPSRSHQGDLSEVELEVRTPWLDRVSGAVYPPGSIVKPLVLAAAVTEGAHGLGHPITCNGHHFPAQPHVARCWIYRQANAMATHGSLQAEEALARSCNCFFYELGARLGLARISDWMHYFGGGRRLEISPSAVGLPGSLPGPEDIAELDRRGESDFEAIMLGIGQGRFTWTPLHAANAFAILARNGRRLPPTLLRGMRASLPDPDRLLDPRAVEAALAGLEASVTKNHGTGSRLRYGPGDYDAVFNVDPVRIWGKTGTAQAPPMRFDLDGDGTLGGDERVEGLHHAWFTGLAGEKEPEYAFAVIVEHGGSGGRVAGPIANQVIHALMETGYLPQSTKGGFH